jgi:SHS2 domain-containing protein
MSEGIDAAPESRPPQDRMEQRFEEFDYGGDIGIEAWGENTARVLEHATLGLFSLMVRGGVTVRVEREIAVRAASAEDLLIDWLSEVIATAGSHGEVYCQTQIYSTGPAAVRGVIRGEPIQSRRHDLRFDVKAATYHEVLFESGEDGCHVRVIFDL